MSFQKQLVQSVPRIRGISQREKHERWWCKWCTSWISYKTKTRTLFSSQLITRFEHGKSLILFILQVKWWTQVDNDTKMSLTKEQVLKCLSTNRVAWLRNAMLDLFYVLIWSLVGIWLSWNTNKVDLQVKESHTSTWVHLLFKNETIFWPLFGHFGLFRPSKTSRRTNSCCRLGCRWIPTKFRLRIRY